MRALIVSSELPRRPRGITSVIRSIAHGLHANGFDVGFLVDSPATPSKTPRELGRRIDHIDVQHYFSGNAESLHRPPRRSALGRFGRLAGIARTERIWRPSVFPLDRSLLGAPPGVLDDADFIVKIPRFYGGHSPGTRRVLFAALRRAIRDEGIDLVVTPTPMGLSEKDVAPAKLLAFVLDLLPLELTELPADGRMIERFAEDLTSTVEGSSALATISEETSLKLRSIFPGTIAPVVYPSVTPSPAARAEDDAAILKRRNLRRGRYLLYVASLEKRKNLDTILDAYALASDEIAIPLIIAGDPGYRFEEIFRRVDHFPAAIRNRIALIGRVTEAEKFALLRGARALVFPSLGEGLGLPVVEALAVGTPAITSRTGALVEAGGDAAFYVDDPRDPAELARALVRVVTDRKLVRDLMRRAPAHVERFSQRSFDRDLGAILHSVSGSTSDPGLLSTDIVNTDLASPRQRAWNARVGLPEDFAHAKLWEQRKLFEALRHHRALRPGARGLGFGVGREELASVFAAEGASVVATDQPPAEAAQKWDNGQFAARLDDIHHRQIVDRATFDQRVEFRPHDMNAFEPEFVNGFDFAWSNCVVGHLGSLEKARAFLRRHAAYLKVGGVSVLTTEMVISSVTETIDRDSDTVVWRLADIHQLIDDLLDVGLVADPFTLRLAEDPSDGKLFFPPFDASDPDRTSIWQGWDSLTIPASKTVFSGLAITQISLVLHRRPVGAWERRTLRRRNAHALRRNTAALEAYLAGDGDIADYRSTYDLPSTRITPITDVYEVAGAPGSTVRVPVRFRNDSGTPVFGHGINTPSGVAPLLLATSDPVNRESALRTPQWFSPNRPAAAFVPEYEHASWPLGSHGDHRALPGETLVYDLHLAVPEVVGVHTERFVLVLEGLGVVPGTEITVSITTTDPEPADSADS